MFGMGHGALRSYTTMDARLIAPKPEQWTFDQASTMPVVWATVWSAFEDCMVLRPNHRVLIHAATGGVGLTAVRYASSTGAEVYATAGRESKHEYLRSTMGIPAGRIGSSRDCGAFRQQMDAVFSGSDSNINGPASADGQLDAVLNSLSHDEYIPESLKMVKDEGHFLEIGKRGIWSAEAMASARPRVLYHVIAVDSRMEEDPAWMGQVLADLGGRVEQGDARVAPLPVEAFDMRTQCVGAFQHLQRAHHIGKVVVTIRPSLVCSMSSKGSCVVSGGTGVVYWLLTRERRSP